MSWFATQVDRDFENGAYGNGIRLYSNNSNQSYILIEGVSYNDGILVLKNAKSNEQIVLSTEPKNGLFETTIYSQWKTWDEKYGKHDEDRTDYEPWAFDSLKSLAMEFGLYKLKDEETISTFYKKNF